MQNSSKQQEFQQEESEFSVITEGLKHGKNTQYRQMFYTQTDKLKIVGETEIERIILFFIVLYIRYLDINQINLISSYTIILITVVNIIILKYFIVLHTNKRTQRNKLMQLPLSYRAIFE